MDLKEFVSQTLTQIVEGVKESQAPIQEKGGKVNPPILHSSEQLVKLGIPWTSEGIAQIVQFDVALTVTEGAGAKAGIGIFSGAINLGGTGETKSESSSVSRIKFSVMLRLPQD